MNNTYLLLLVERIVRPVCATSINKLKMRNKLLDEASHLHNSYVSLGYSEKETISKVIEKYPKDITLELQKSVPLHERFVYRFFSSGNKGLDFRAILIRQFVFITKFMLICTSLSFLINCFIAIIFGVEIVLFGLAFCIYLWGLMIAWAFFVNSVFGVLYRHSSLNKFRLVSFLILCVFTVPVFAIIRSYSLYDKPDSMVDYFANLFWYAPATCMIGYYGNYFIANILKITYRDKILRVSDWIFANAWICIRSTAALLMTFLIAFISTGKLEGAIDNVFVVLSFYLYLLLPIQLLFTYPKMSSSFQELDKWESLDLKNIENQL